MKPILFYIFIFISAIGFSQIVSFNETTQLLNKPHGKPLFQINAGVEYWYHDPGYEDSWAEIEVPCFVLKSSVSKSAVVEGTILFDYTGNNIGIVLNNTKCNTEPNTFGYLKSFPDSLEYIRLTGFVEKEKLSEIINLSEIIKNNIGYGDSCVSRIFTFNNTAGESQTIHEDNRFYFTFLGKKVSSVEEVLIKEETTTLTLYGADGDLRSMTVEIIKDYDTDNPQSYFISNEAYKCDIGYNKIIFYEYNWSAGPEERYLYSVSTFKQLMNFHGNLYTVSIPGSDIDGFIGYKPSPSDWDSTYSGNICFATPEKVLINKKIICNKKELVRKLTCFDAKIRFVPLNNKDEICDYDSTRLILKSKSGCNTETCLSGFRITMSLGYDRYDIPITLEFRDGDIFIVKNYEDAFELR